MLTKADSDGIFGSDITTITYVLLVNVSMNAANELFPSIALNLEQINLNCFMILETDECHCTVCLGNAKPLEM